jgi:hypothetical protein
MDAEATQWWSRGALSIPFFDQDEPKLFPILEESGWAYPVALFGGASSGGNACS